MMRFDMRAPGKTAAERAALYRAAVEMAAWADTRGCAALVISEHHASDDGYLPSPLLLAASMAAVTKNTPISVAAALLALYDPVRLAEDMIVLDHISNGRMMFVLGLGYRPVEYELYGVDYAARGRVVDEKLETLLAALRGGSDGPQITPPPFTPGGPMIAWGGATKAAARRAGRNGIAFFGQADRPGLQEAYEQAARDAGYEPGMCMLPSPANPTSLFVNDDVDTGWAEVGPALLADAIPYYAWNVEAGSADYTVSLSRSQTVDELRKEHGSHRVVTVAEAADLMRTHGLVQLQPLCGGLDPEVAWRYLQRVVDDVMPAAAAGG
jgi:alkanesulfonate monooxygenase SsuD/methylene tetrahydromethanopterin reductase-like flavin-dependent oxidoreductase (luciferase family)